MTQVPTAPARPNVLRRVRRRLRSYPLIPAFVLLALLILPAITADWLAPHDPVHGSVKDRRQPPVFFGGTWEYPLGTDRIGRDILSRIMYGARVSLFISLVGIFVGGIIGASLGMLAGYFGGWIDTVIMRLVDISLALPAILLALVLAAATGPSFQTIIVVVAFVLWALYARQVRGEVLSIRERDFVARARVAGASQLRVMARHILPNVTNTIIVLATLQVGIGHHPRGGPELSRAGHSTPHPGLGDHGRGRPPVDCERVVDLVLPGPRDHPHGLLAQPAGRLAARPPGSEAETDLMFRAQVSPIFCCGRRPQSGDRAYSLKPLHQRASASVDYAFSAFQSVRPVTAAFRRPRDEDR